MHLETYQENALMTILDSTILNGHCSSLDYICSHIGNPVIVILLVAEGGNSVGIR